jgi:hypothetical protein
MASALCAVLKPGQPDTPIADSRSTYQPQGLGFSLQDLMNVCGCSLAQSSTVAAAMHILASWHVVLLCSHNIAAP